MQKKIIITLSLISLCILGIAILLIIKFYKKDDDSSNIKARNQECEMEIIDNELPPLETEESNNARNLENSEFKQFKIYIDLTYMTYQAGLDINLSKNFNKITKSMEKAKTPLENIFTVSPFQKNWILRAEVLEKLGVLKYNSKFKTNRI